MLNVECWMFASSKKTTPPRPRERSGYRGRGGLLAQTTSELYRAFSEAHDGPQHHGGDTAHQQPHGLVRRVAGEEAGNVRTERIDGVDAEDGEDDSCGQESHSNSFTHKLTFVAPNGRRFLFSQIAFSVAMGKTESAPDCP